MTESIGRMLYKYIATTDGASLEEADAKFSALHVILRVMWQRLAKEYETKTHGMWQTWVVAAVINGEVGDIATVQLDFSDLRNIKEAMDGGESAGRMPLCSLMWVVPRLNECNALLASLYLDPDLDVQLREKRTEAPDGR